MPLRTLRMLANETTTQRMHAWRTPLPMFRCITFIRQAILNSQDCFIRPSSCFIRNGLASILKHSQRFVCIRMDEC